VIAVPDMSIVPIPPEQVASLIAALTSDNEIVEEALDALMVLVRLNDAPLVQRVEAAMRCDLDALDCLLEDLHDRRERERHQVETQPQDWFITSSPIRAGQSLRATMARRRTDDDLATFRMALRG